MADSPGNRDVNPLVARVDALLRSHQEAQQAADTEVPVLTEIADAAGGGPRALDPASLEALVAALEQAVRARLGPELQRTLDACLVRAVPQLVETILRDSRERIRANLQIMLREAIAEAVARSLGGAQAGADAAPAGTAPDAAPRGAAGRDA